MDDDIRQRLAILEAKVEHLGRLAGVTFTSDEGPAAVAGGSSVPADVLAPVQAGNTIGAIKAYREHFDVDLATAKAAVERLV